LVELTKTPIDLNTLLQQLEDHTAGGLVVFLGRVRNHSDGREIKEMDYEAYPDMAMGKMQQIEQKAMERWPIKKVIICHRTGNLKLGELSVVIGVASAHRKEAFEACRFIIDTLKETVPIWKKEYFDAGESWVEGNIPQ
jgi:molybdopterin synthase catalytic subunit